VKDLGEPRDVARSLRHNNRAFGSLPYQTAPLLMIFHPHGVSSNRTIFQPRVDYNLRAYIYSCSR